MRLRNVKNAKQIIENCSYAILKPEEYKGCWQQLFGNNNSIYLEIGMGKGQFISQMAMNNPEINYIGLEKYSSVIAKAIQKNEETEPHNLKLICFDAININNIFDHEIEGIYLNFSDPWPKERHAKRRLTSDIFLKLYDDIFKNQHNIYMKTDNKPLYDYSLEQFTNHKYTVKTMCYDLATMPGDNVMTEYEARFLNKGNVIYKIEAHQVNGAKDL